MNESGGDPGLFSLKIQRLGLCRNDVHTALICVILHTHQILFALSPTVPMHFQLLRTWAHLWILWILCSIYWCKLYGPCSRALLAASSWATHHRETLDNLDKEEIQWVFQDERLCKMHLPPQKKNVAECHPSCHQAWKLEVKGMMLAEGKPSSAWNFIPKLPKEKSMRRESHIFKHDMQGFRKTYCLMLSGSC